MVQFKQTSEFGGILNDDLNDFATIQYEAEHHLFMIDLLCYTMPDNMIEAYIQAGLFCRQNQYLVLRSISDLSKFEGSFDDISDWLTKKYMPGLIKYGFKAIAYVKGRDLFTQLSHEFQLEEMRKLCLCESFDTFEEAYQWVIKT